MKDLLLFIPNENDVYFQDSVYLKKKKGK